MTTSLDVQFQLCDGSDCRKRKKRQKKLRAAFEDVVGLRTIKCQDICKGPVVVVCLEQERYWFKKVGNKKARRQLLNFIQGEKLGSYLKKRLVKRRPLKSKIVGGKKVKRRFKRTQAPERSRGH